MDKIRKDTVKSASGSAPRRTGKLERSYFVTQNNIDLKQCQFSVRFSALNKGFDYADWTHFKTYRLGRISRQKQPPKSRFAEGLYVGNNYLYNVAESAEINWGNFIRTNLRKSMVTKLKG
ncbi:hypothetical protein [Clostridium felsineum]|uniref:hypothetical protein n=1 Tax=Clostridium felsineum TaxID=36839 RepID=UPI0011156A54|nr:hypothetical protein [Clostridium felsineum]